VAKVANATKSQAADAFYNLHSFLKPWFYPRVIPNAISLLSTFFIAKAPGRRPQFIVAIAPPPTREEDAKKTRTGDYDFVLYRQQITSSGNSVSTTRRFVANTQGLTYRPITVEAEPLRFVLETALISSRVTGWSFRITVNDTRNRPVTTKLAHEQILPFGQLSDVDDAKYDFDENHDYYITDATVKAAISPNGKVPQQVLKSGELKAALKTPVPKNTSFVSQSNYNTIAGRTSAHWSFGGNAWNYAHKMISPAMFTYYYS